MYSMPHFFLNNILIRPNDFNARLGTGTNLKLVNLPRTLRLVEFEDIFSSTFSQAIKVRTVSNIGTVHAQWTSLMNGCLQRRPHRRSGWAPAGRVRVLAPRRK